MKQAKQDGRKRLVAATADLLSRRGVNGLSIRDLAVHAGAPLGSTYHYFPGGKQQLVTEALEFSGREVAVRLAAALQLGPLAGLRSFVGAWRKRIVASDYLAGCPVLSVATREPNNDKEAHTLASAAAEFDRWAGLFSESLRGAGISAHEADELATLVVAAVEGAIGMCRAQRRTRPLDEVSRQLEKLLSAATPGAPALSG